MGPREQQFQQMRLVLVLAAALCVAAVTAEYSSVEEDVVPETSLVESATASVAAVDVTRRSKRFRVCRHRARHCHKRVARSRLAKRAKAHAKVAKAHSKAARKAHKKANKHARKAGQWWRFWRRAAHRNKSRKARRKAHKHSKIT